MKKELLNELGKEWENIDHFSAPARIVRNLCQKSEKKFDILEIGTGYGEQLPFFSELCNSVISIDCMYHWVPDVQSHEGFDEEKVDEKKLESWNKNSSENCELILGNSFDVYKKHEDELEVGFDIIIVDGCHHPAEAVSDDYKNYFKFMRIPHIAIFDDMQTGDCRRGADQSKEFLEENGYSVFEKNVTHNGIKASVMLVTKE